MNNKIIFLDIDGVLNSELWYTAFRKKINDPIIEKDLVSNAFGATSNKVEILSQDLDPHTVARLNDIVDLTGAGVVITSTWRMGRECDELQEILDGAGFTGQIIGTTPCAMRWSLEHSSSILRGNEILAWMQNNFEITKNYFDEYRNYVILDDDDDMLFWQRNNFVQVDSFVGLTPNNAQQAIKILNP
jgi:hypothetical protein